MIIYIFCLLPLPVPKVFTGQALGHCTAAAGKSAEEVHGVENVYYGPVLPAVHSFDPPIFGISGDDLYPKEVLFNIVYTVC